MIKLKKANDDKRELIQKMEWSEKFWRDKLVTLEKEKQNMEQKHEDIYDECRRYKDLYQKSQSE